MKKKVITVVLVSLFLLSSTVFASGINGMFEGYPIINVEVDGKKIESDTPAISFNGRTMVPVRFVTESMGGTVTWVSSSQTVKVSTQVNKDGNSQEIDTIKFYNKIGDQYHQLSLVGDSIHNMKTELNLSFFYIIEDLSDPLDNNSQPISLAINTYSKTRAATLDLMEEAKNKNIDISNMNEILNHYDQAIDIYLDAHRNLKSMYEEIDKGITEERFMAIVSEFDRNMLAGSEKVILGSELSLQGYNEFLNKVTNY
jgi:hypothetical protein